ncbi:MAG: amino acid ABC transporter permease [Methylobacteriaceae bacterium]|nr:amino acid ABC transporter permease [Methylobacteriaceae bacterium]
MNAATAQPPRPKFWNDPFWRGMVFQGLLLVVVLALFAAAVINARDNMQARGIPTGFAFWDRPASFDINQTLISYSATSPNSRVFWVGLINTLLVSGLGVVLSTIIGFAIGAARLSGNWLIARLAAVYVESLRNVPLLLQIIFWYNVVLGNLPSPRQAKAFLEVAFLTNRGLFAPAPVAGPGMNAVWIALAGGVIVAFAFGAWARKRQRDTGAQAPVGRVAAALIVGLPLVVFFALGMPLHWDMPKLRGFNFTGGQRLTPEFVALLLALTLYTAAFIAEIVRSGIAAVPKGQSEAAAALGLRPGPTRKLVIMPQAMRVIIPPLINQYLNLTKNSTLAVAIGYPDLFNVFAGTVLNNTGAAVQIIFMTMAVYLAMSLITSAIMNFYNARMSLKER